MGPKIWDTSTQCRADLILNPSFCRLFYYVFRHRVWQRISISFYKSGLQTLDNNCRTLEGLIQALFQSLIFARFDLRSCKIPSNPTPFQAKLHLNQCDGAGQKIFEWPRRRSLRTWRCALTHHRNFGVLIWLLFVHFLDRLFIFQSNTDSQSYYLIKKMVSL